VYSDTHIQMGIEICNFEMSVRCSTRSMSCCRLGVEKKYARPMLFVVIELPSNSRFYYVSRYTITSSKFLHLVTSTSKENYENHKVDLLWSVYHTVCSKRLWKIHHGHIHIAHTTIFVLEVGKCSAALALAIHDNRESAFLPCTTHLLCCSRAIRP
jgi:hypothetical protein